MARRRARVTVKGDLGAPCFAVLWTEETLPEFPDVPCVKKCLQRRKRLRSIGQQLGTKSGRRPGDGPLNNRSSTGRRVFSIPDLSNPKPGHTTGGSGRGGARRRGSGAGRGRVGRDADGSIRPGDDRPSCLPGYRKQLS